MLDQKVSALTTVVPVNPFVAVLGGFIWQYQSQGQAAVAAVSEAFKPVLLSSATVAEQALRVTASGCGNLDSDSDSAEPVQAPEPEPL